MSDEKEAKEEARRPVSEVKKMFNGADATNSKKLSASQLQQVYKIVKEINEGNFKKNILFK